MRRCWVFHRQTLEAIGPAPLANFGLMGHRDVSQNSIYDGSRVIVYLVKWNCSTYIIPDRLIYIQKKGIKFAVARHYSASRSSHNQSLEPVAGLDQPQFHPHFQQ